MAEEKKLRSELNDVSLQLISMIDISNAIHFENLKLKKKNEEIDEEKTQLVEMFRLQTLLFVLLILLIFWTMHCRNKIKN